MLWIGVVMLWIGVVIFKVWLVAMIIFAAIDDRWPE